jgi:hypothetical protein
MKRILLLLSILFFAAEVSWSYCNGDHQFIPIRVLDNSTETGRENRSQEFIPIQACYDDFSSSIYIQFLQNIGGVDIAVTNSDTGYNANYEVDSSLGTTILPISGGCGLYYITFILSGGEGYQGELDIF